MTPRPTARTMPNPSSGKDQKPLGHFPDMVAYTDKLIGKLVAKLEELHLRDNTLLLILGDNGTGRGTPSKFKGRDVLGGKGTTTMWGTHVPPSATGRATSPAGKVYRRPDRRHGFPADDLRGHGHARPGGVENRRPQFPAATARRKGQPREWLYAWYNPSGGATAKAEFAHDAQFKLYTDGRFYAVDKDDNEKSPLADAALDAGARRRRPNCRRRSSSSKGRAPSSS